MFKSCHPDMTDKEWEEGMKKYLKSPEYKASLKKDLENLANTLNGGGWSCPTEEHY